MQLPDDPILLELVPDFVVSWTSDVNTVLPALVAARNTDELYRFGHTLKGSARQFGFAELADCGSEIMHIAREARWDALGEIIEHVRALLKAIEQCAREHNLPIPERSTTNL